MELMENILNEAVTLLEKGLTKQEVLSKWPNRQAELKPLLETLELLRNLPKNQAPKPAMQKKYVHLPVSVRFAFLGWIRTSRLATASMAAVLLITAGIGTGYAAWNSLPGTALFSLKKSEERLLLQFATSEAQKAQLQIQFANNRLNEAQQIFDNPASNSQAQQAALSELVSETQNTINSISAAAKDNTLDQNSHPIVASLEDITKKQQALLSQIKTDNKNQLATKSAIAVAQQNASKVEQIKNYIQAASNEQILANLNANPNGVSITGNITQLTNANITVEKTGFLITGQTQIEDSANNNISLTVLTVGGKVKVLGHKTDEKLFADQIFTVNPSEQNTAASSTPPGGDGQSSVDGNQPEVSTTPNSILNLKSSQEKSPAQSPNNSGAKPAATVPANSNTATGGIIIEDPAPQSGF